MEKIFFENSNKEKICGIIDEPNPAKEEIIIVVHGFSSHKERGAKNVSEELSKNEFNNLRIDLDDNGESEPKFEFATISKYVETVKSAIDFCRNLGYKEVSLLGTSTGGLVVIATALKYPEIKRLILRSPTSSNDADIIKMKKDGKFIEYKEERYFIYLSSRGVEKKIGFEFAEDGHQYTMYDKVKDIKVPTLIIQGTEDKEVDYKNTEKLANGFPNAKLELIEGADHSLGINGDYTRSLKIVIDWLKNVYK